MLTRMNASTAPIMYDTLCPKVSVGSRIPPRGDGPICAGDPSQPRPRRYRRQLGPREPAQQTTKERLRAVVGMQENRGRATSRRLCLSLSLFGRATSRRLCLSLALGFSHMN